MGKWVQICRECDEMREKTGEKEERCKKGMRQRRIKGGKGEEITKPRNAEP